MENLTKYGFSIGDKVVLKVDTYNEDNEPIKAGTFLRIVAIAPKVCYTPKFRIESQPQFYDSKVYFYNAVLWEQEKDYGKRIRENFVTIKKVK